MSEEEKEVIERLDYFESDDLVECAIYRDCVEKIKNLIDNRQKEIEERETRLQEEINENCKLKTELYGNSISKDKIREIIDICDNTHEQYVELPNGKVIDRNYCGYLIEYLKNY